jgi:hypothetical protein
MTHDARHLGIEPIAELGCLSPEGANEAAIVELDIDQSNCDRQDGDEPWNRHGANLDELDAHEPRVGPHDLTIALHAGVFEQHQSKGGWQFRQRVRHGKARSAV